MFTQIHISYTYTYLVIYYNSQSERNITDTSTRLTISFASKHGGQIRCDDNTIFQTLFPTVFNNNLESPIQILGCRFILLERYALIPKTNQYMIHESNCMTSKHL